METMNVLLGGFFLAGLSVLWLLQRRGKLRIRLAQPSERFPLEVIARLHLSNQHSVQVLRARNRVLVLGVSTATIAVLDSFAWEESAHVLPSPEELRRAG